MRACLLMKALDLLLWIFARYSRGVVELHAEIVLVIDDGSELRIWKSFPGR